MDDDLDHELDPEQGEHDHHVPGDLLELYEVLEWEAALEGRPVDARFVNPFADPGTVVSRAGWGARPPSGVTRLTDPQGTTWHYEGPTMGAFPHTSCPTKVRGIQAFHMNGRGWTDIAYNMLACPHGVAFEGRGRDVRSAANGTNTGNGSSHAVCALTGVGDPHPPGIFVGLLTARQYLMDGGTGPRVWTHREWKATACPGEPIHRWKLAGSLPPDGGEQFDPLPADLRAVLAGASRDLSTFRAVVGL